MTYSVELLSLFDPRFLDHRPRDLERVEALKEQCSIDPPGIVEIGCERGDFLIGLAKTHPTTRILGLEWRASFARSATERMKRRGVDNVIISDLDAKLAIPHALAMGSLQEVHVTFPDPWWKEKHVHRRVLEPLFLRVIARRLAPGGRLYLKSDVFEYLVRVRACAEASGAFRPLPPERWPDERTWTWTTREKKCMQAAIPFGRGYYERLDSFRSALPETPERAEDFPVPDDIDPVALIRGAPPVDRAHRERVRDQARKTGLVGESPTASTDGRSVPPKGLP
jgi:tRNA (guanine-N7-)-methyltransferase